MPKTGRDTREQDVAQPEADAWALARRPEEDCASRDRSRVRRLNFTASLLDGRLGGG